MPTDEESVFKRLRPSCVKLSQLSLQVRAGARVDVKELNLVLGSLHHVLGNIDKLDDALCDYVLFPILPLFRQASTLPPSVVALSLQCLREVLEKGRSVTAKAEVTRQLLVLFMTLLQQQIAALPKQTASEQLVLEICRCLESLLSHTKPVFPEAPPKGADPHLVITGNLLADLLDVATSEQLAAARVSALMVVERLMSYETNVDILRRFLPGILSKLARPMFTTSTRGTSFKAIVASLKVMMSILPRSIRGEEKQDKDHAEENKEDAGHDEWLQKSGPHIKSALQSVAKLASHPKTEVAINLFDLCKRLLASPEISEELRRLLLDCCVGICGREDDGINKKRPLLAETLREQKDLSEIFFDLTTSALQSLSSTMQAADHSKREDGIKKVQSCVLMASMLPPGLEDLTDTIAECLLDCTRLMEASSKSEAASGAAVAEAMSLDLRERVSIDEIFTSRSGAQSDVGMLKGLLSTVMDTRFAGPVLDSLVADGELVHGQVGIARMWDLTVCIEAIKAHQLAKQSKPGDMLLAYRDEALARAYDASLALLDRAPLSADWRSQALSLRMVADYAIASGPDFRPELSFALYPVVERLACGDERLRRHAGDALRRMAAACGYGDAQDILLCNADYLVNAVGIRLTDLEPRPEAARVLQAAIRIGGAAMLPHVRDVIESVFAVLDSYHGYPDMVAAMFAVLEATVDQAPVDESPAHAEPLLKPEQAPLTVAEYIEKIRKVSARKGAATDSDAVDEEIISAEARDLAADAESESEPESDSNGTALASAADKSAAAMAKTVESIVRYGQHYLTYEAPAVRRGVLGVLARGLRALPEDLLLPAINDVWPVLAARAHDPDPTVAVAGLAAVAAAVRAAGAFLSTRIEDEWARLRALGLRHRPALGKLALGKLTKTSLIPHSSANNPADLTYTAAGRIWAALCDLLAALVLHTRTTAAIEADLFALFASARRPHTTGLRRALALLNPDALWLADEKERVALAAAAATVPASVPPPSSRPTLDGYVFAPALA